MTPNDNQSSENDKYYNIRIIINNIKIKERTILMLIFVDANKIRIPI